MPAIIQTTSATATMFSPAPPEVVIPENKSFQELPSTEIYTPQPPLLHQQPTVDYIEARIEARTGNNGETTIASARNILQESVDLETLFTFHEELGNGAMGIVYKATAKDNSIVPAGITVAVKVLRETLTREEKLEIRFSDEIKLLKKLNHPNIVPFISSGHYKDRQAFVMKFVDGKTLEEILKDPNKKNLLPPKKFFQVMEQIARATAYAHDRGILHRDIKPVNIILNADSSSPENIPLAQLADFGIAKITGRKTKVTSVGAFLGTPRYMAPEAITKGDPIEIFPFGVMMYEYFLGVPPYTDNKNSAIPGSYDTSNKPKDPTTLNRSISLEIASRMKALVNVDPTQRGHSVEDLADWFKAEQELISSTSSTTIIKEERKVLPPQRGKLLLTRTVRFLLNLFS